MPNSQNPASPDHLAANRANAAKSTGPRTSQRKTRSAQNARKHGFTASTFAVIRLEGIDEVARLKEDALAFHQPALVPAGSVLFPTPGVSRFLGQRQPGGAGLLACLLGVACRAGGRGQTGGPGSGLVPPLASTSRSGERR